MITRRQLLGGLAVAASAPEVHAVAVAAADVSPGAFETEDILCCYAARPDFKKTSALRARSAGALRHAGDHRPHRHAAGLPPA